MGQLKTIVVIPGLDSWFSPLFFILSTLAALAILTTPAAWPIKFAALGGLLLFIFLNRWRTHCLKPFRELRIYGNGALMLISHSGREIPGILENDSWTTRWVSIVAVGRFDRWGVQRLLVCAGRNSASDYRQLLKRLRQNQPHNGILV